MRIHQISSSISILLLAVLWSLTGIGCGTTAKNTGAFSSLGTAGAGSESRLRSGDQIQIRIDTGSTQQPQQFEVVIDENGEVSLPLVGRVKAADGTSSELAERIQTSYVPRFYVHCNATVMATIRFFYVGGEVRSPGRYNWTEDVTLLKSINTAGGFTDYSNRRKVEIARGKGKQVFDCEDIRQHPAKDVPIKPGDSIYVARSIF
jgi:polysaccharide biosynthesis/export protein VpsN